MDLLYSVYVFVDNKKKYAHAYVRRAWTSNNCARTLKKALNFNKYLNSSKWKYLPMIDIYVFIWYNNYLATIFLLSKYLFIINKCLLNTI